MRWSSSAASCAKLPGVFYVHRISQPPAGAVNLPLAEGSELALADHPPPIGPGSRAELARLFPAGMTNHGRGYMTLWPGEQSRTWGTEVFLEAVRRADHPNKPSRMTSAYAFETIEDARAFIGRYGLNVVQSVIFEVDGRIMHRGNMELASLDVSRFAVAFAFAVARAYWLGEQGPAPALWEVLLEPPVRLGRVVDADVR
jgi:hypothetical protein